MSRTNAQNSTVRPPPIAWAISFVVGLGVLALMCSALLQGDAWWDRSSIDWAGRAARRERLPEVLMVDVDEDAIGHLGADPQGNLVRTNYANFLRLLAVRPPRLIFFDMASPYESSRPGDDAEFSAALASTRRVVIGAFTREAGEVGQAPVFESRLPIAAFRTNALWGYLDLWPSSRDEVVRRLIVRPPDRDPEYRSAAWVAARCLGAAAASSDLAVGRERWLNYHGAAKNTFRHLRLEDILHDPTLLPSDLTNLLVFVGSSPSIARPGRLKDSSPHPAGGSVPRAEIQATSVVNLIRDGGQWLERVAGGWQLLIIVGWGVLTAHIAIRWESRQALAGLMVATVWLAALAVLCQRNLGLWWSWVIPVMIQTPAALACLLASRAMELGLGRPGIRERPTGGEPS